MNTVTNILNPLAASEQFMLRDLTRSGLTPDDFPVSPQPLTPIDGVARYRIHYAQDGYWQDRYDRDAPKYLGPKGAPTDLFWPQAMGVFTNATSTNAYFTNGSATTFSTTNSFATNATTTNATFSARRSKLRKSRPQHRIGEAFSGMHIRWFRFPEITGD